MEIQKFSPDSFLKNYGCSDEFFSCMIVDAERCRDTKPKSMELRIEETSSPGSIVRRAARHRVRIFSRNYKGYSADQMFDVVFTVAEYPKFVPWCKTANVRKLGDNVLDCEMFIGFPPLTEHYTSRVTGLPPNVIRSICTDGRLFHVLDTTWRFGPPPAEFSALSACTLLFSLEFEFKSSLHAQLSRMFFAQVVQRMVAAFLHRAQHVYGPPAFDHFAKEPEILSYCLKPE